MTSKHRAALRTTQFLEKLAIILDTPEIKTFQWSGDGKSVAIISKYYEEELVCFKELSILKKFKDIASLHGFLGSHGFKKMPQSSSADIHIFQHPGFSIKGAATVKGWCKRRVQHFDPSVHGPRQEEPLKKPKRKKPKNGPAAFPPELFYPPVKNRNARTLYQYINHSKPAQDSPDSRAEACPAPEHHDSSNTL